jgi:hypothetical protein
MDRKCKTGVTVNMLLGPVTALLLLRVIVPVLMLTSAHRYADKFLLSFNIQSKEGYVTVLTAFAYEVIFATVIDGTEFMASDRSTVLYYPSLEVGDDSSVAESPPESRLLRLKFRFLYLLKKLTIQTSTTRLKNHD